MIAATNVVLALALAATAQAQFAPTKVLNKRYNKVTGCTCCGYDVSLGSDLDNMTTYFILNWANGQGSSNTGYCFQDGELEDESVEQIRQAYVTKTSNAYVNYEGLRQICAARRWNTEAACVNGVVKGYHDFIVGPDGTSVSEWIHTECTYPPANFVPTDCYCGWECADGYTKCGNTCIDSSTTTCASGIASRRRSEIPFCAPGEELCAMPNTKGFACIDVTDNLESCGGCPFTPTSVDCTSIPGVDGVACAAGECVVESCSWGYQLVNGTCV